MSESGEAAIRVDAITKSYGRNLALDAVSFAVSPGEVMGFLGPNGSGKTTTMRILMGLISATSGDAYVRGRLVRRADHSIRSSVGYLPGSLNLYPRMTVKSLLTFLANLRRVDCSARIADLCQRMDLPIHAKISSLSKGNRQKVGVISAFMHQPDVLILDEPTSGLDPLVQQVFESLINESCSKGAAALLSSHVLSEVEHLATRVAIIDQGRLVAFDSTDSLRQRAIRTVELDFPDAPSAAAFASDTRRDDPLIHGTRVTCRVVGTETALLRHAVDHGVVAVRTHEPNLEDVFLDLVTGR